MQPVKFNKYKQREMRPRWQANYCCALIQPEWPGHFISLCEVAVIENGLYLLLLYYPAIPAWQGCFREAELARLSDFEIFVERTCDNITTVYFFVGSIELHARLDIIETWLAQRAGGFVPRLAPTVFQTSVAAQRHTEFLFETLLTIPGSRLPVTRWTFFFIIQCPYPIIPCFRCSTDVSCVAAIATQSSDARHMQCSEEFFFLLRLIFS